MSTHAHFRPPPARNEPVGDFAPGSPERASLEKRLARMAGERIEIPVIIGGEDVTTGDTRPAVMPHDKEHVLADVHQASAEHVQRAIDTAAAAWEDWSRWPWEDRAAVFLRAAELLAGPWRDTLNAATMLATNPSGS
jgi:1-pyrroline-5-carboxylate dehydrogenase